MVKGRGLSPRVRGNHASRVILSNKARTIPACAGEPLQSGDCNFIGWDYPRVCGGTFSRLITFFWQLVLSPRVRGNLILPAGVLVSVSTIPACAGEPITS